MQAALRQAWAAKPEATQAQALRHAVASKVSPQRLTPGCLVHHQPKGDSWLRLRWQGSNQAMTSGKCCQPEIKWLQIQVCTPFLPQAILQKRCGAVLLSHPTTHPPNKWKSVQLSKGHCFYRRPKNIVFADTPKHLDAGTRAIIQTILVTLSGPPMLLHHPPPRTQKLRMRQYPKG